MLSSAGATCVRGSSAACSVVAPLPTFHTLFGFEFQLLGEGASIADVKAILEHSVGLCSQSDGEDCMRAALTGRASVYGLDPPGFLDHLRWHSVSLFDLSEVLGVVRIECERDSQHHDQVYSVPDAGIQVKPSCEFSFVGWNPDPIDCLFCCKLQDGTPVSEFDYLLYFRSLRGRWNDFGQSSLRFLFEFINV